MIGGNGTIVIVSNFATRQDSTLRVPCLRPAYKVPHRGAKALESRFDKGGFGRI